FNGASIEFACIFKGNQLGKIKRGDLFILSIQSPIIIGKVNVQSEIEKLPSDCFLVSFCFGRNSLEYERCITFRDTFLSGNFIGEAFINVYYKRGPFFKKLLQQYPILISPTRIILLRIIHTMTKLLKFKNVQ
ncbi:MAG: hypothetical protein AAGK97_17265, partial [Bacteroidota bacterium]